MTQMTIERAREIREMSCDPYGSIHADPETVALCDAFIASREDLSDWARFTFMDKPLAVHPDIASEIQRALLKVAFLAIEPTPEMLARFVSVYHGHHPTDGYIVLTKRQLRRARMAYGAMNSMRESA